MKNLNHKYVKKPNYVIQYNPSWKKDNFLSQFRAARPPISRNYCRPAFFIRIVL